MINNNKKTLILLVVLVGATLVSASIAWFLFGIISEESTHVKTAETGIAILEAKTRDLVEAKEDLKNHADAIASIKQSFVSEDHFVDFVRLTEELGRTAGVVLRVNSADLPAQGGTVRVSMEVTGTYAQITQFIALLDRMPYPSIIANTSISPEAVGQSGRVRAGLRLDVFNYQIQ
jgi:hypothetical protein